jgi:hypothetical protein
MKLKPKIEAALLTLGALIVIALFVTIAMMTPELLYTIILGGVAIASVRFIYDIALDHIERRNKIKQLNDEFYAEKK